MIPCPYCDREFEKRAGLMRHVTASHHSEGAVPTNPGGALEAVVPVEPETYAETLDEVADGQAPYIDPPTPAELVVAGVEAVTDEQASSVFAGAIAQLQRHAALQDLAETALATTLGSPTPEEYRRIRGLRREGHSEQVAWMTVLGQTPPEREAPPEDARPLRLQQVAFRVRNTEIDQIDAAWLLHLAEIGLEAVEALHREVLISEVIPDVFHCATIIERWNEAIR